jgi:hypothetical protein
VKMEMPIATLYEQAAMEANKAAAKQVLARARELSPTLTGDSDKTGFVATDDLTTQVGFRSVVSRFQHENLDFEHPQGGQPKFLETAADEVNMESIAADAVRKKLG